MGRWTIAGGLAIIAAVALSLAAIRDASAVWAAAVTPVVGATFAFALAMGLLRRGRRAGWLGFAIPGGAYFLYSLVALPVFGPIPFVSPAIETASSRLEPPPPPIRDQLPPSDQWMRLPLEMRWAIGTRMAVDSEKHRQYTVAMQSRRVSFRAIAHSLLSLLIGLGASSMIGFGAFLGRRRAAPDGGKADDRSPEGANIPCP